MRWFSFAVALSTAVAIIWIGVRYLTNPRTMAPSFGLRPPADDEAVWWWLRLKGVRDVASGVLILSLLALGADRILGVALLVDALIPLGDMATVLAGRGRVGTALGVHGSTAALMVLGAVPLLIDAR